MSEKIKPALTPAEWASQQIRRRGEEVSYVKIGVPRPCVVEGYTRDDEDFDCGDVDLAWPETRHAVAAVCLHGQPFGFTRDDVGLMLLARDAGRIVTDEPGGVPRYAGRPLTFGEHNRLRDLADRIEALLPPDEGNPT